jgi:hypothetical protein
MVGKKVIDPLTKVSFIELIVDDLVDPFDEYRQFVCLTHCVQLVPESYGNPVIAIDERDIPIPDFLLHKRVESPVGDSFVERELDLLDL